METAITIVETVITIPWNERSRSPGTGDHDGGESVITMGRNTHQEAKRAWGKWLRRRSQRVCLTWERFQALLKDFPLPRPTIRVRIWAPAP